MKVRVVIAVVAAFLAAACTSEPINGSTEISFSGPGEQQYEFGRIRAGEVGLDGTRPDGGVFYVDGSTVYVNFPGGRIGNIEEDPCVAQYDMTADETPENVQITVYRVAAKDPPPDGMCPAAKWFVTLSLDLSAPLGERTLSTGPHKVNPAFIDARREPTWVPGSWSATTETLDPVRGGTLFYGSEVRVEIQAMADKPGVEIVRGNRHHVNVSILGVDDGAVVTRERSGEHRLGFDEAGWFYDFLAEPNVNRDELVEFARSFEIPST